MSLPGADPALYQQEGENMKEYREFISDKYHEGAEFGFDPVWIPDKLFPFQVAMVEWALRKGRAAIFADCGMGKTFVQIVWAENVARKTGGRVLILTPLAVAFQTVIEGEKIGVEVVHRRTGIEKSDRIVVTNYERLHYFSPDDFQAVICDESSILKNLDGAMRGQITDFMRKRPYRLLCTATAAPNDYIELGTSSEALGDMGAQDMLNRFFKKTEKALSRSEQNRAGTFRFRGHAEQAFWRWVVSWARAARKPSDMGFDDGAFLLPPLENRSHVVSPKGPRPGFLFEVPAIGLKDQRSDLRRTIEERCQMAADLVNRHGQQSVVWCNLNEEGDILEKKINGAVQVAGKDTEEHKESSFQSFLRGDARVLVSKPTIAGFGLNFQHCAHQTFFPSHSYEQYYQAVRRCWRFGQKKKVVVDIITTEGQSDVMKNLERKAEQAAKMFDVMVSLMWKEERIKRENRFKNTEEVPSWL